MTISRALPLLPLFSTILDKLIYNAGSAAILRLHTAPSVGLMHLSVALCLIYPTSHHSTSHLSRVSSVPRLTYSAAYLFRVSSVPCLNYSASYLFRISHIPCLKI